MHHIINWFGVGELNTRSDLDLSAGCAHCMSQLICLGTNKRLELCKADTSAIIVGREVGVNSTNLCQGVLTLLHVTVQMCRHQEWVVALDLALSRDWESSCHVGDNIPSDHRLCAVVMICNLSW